MKAIIFGGIGTLVETSELQRQSFNDAFEALGIPWRWDRATYRRLLSVAGGQNRIRHFSLTQPAHRVPDDALVARAHELKTQRFQAALESGSLALRGGIQRLINKAQSSDVKIALASTTLASNIRALADASCLSLDEFDVLLHRGLVAEPKPHPEVYLRCLELLGVAADEAVAFEDSDSGVEAANAAGVTCIAMPGDNTSHHAFDDAAFVVGRSRGESLSNRFGNNALGMTGLDPASFRELLTAIR